MIEGIAEEIKLVSETIKEHFKDESQIYRDLEMIENSLIEWI